MNTRIVEMDEEEYAELRRYARLGAERRSRRTGLLGWALWGMVAAFLFIVVAVSTPYHVSLLEDFGLPHLRYPPVSPGVASPTVELAPTAAIAPTAVPGQREQAGPSIDQSNRTRIGLDDSGKPYVEREERLITPATPAPPPPPTEAPRQVVVDAGIKSSGPYVNVESKPVAADAPAALPPAPAANAGQAEVEQFKQSFAENDRARTCQFIGCLATPWPTSTLPQPGDTGFKDSFK